MGDEGIIEQRAPVVEIDPDLVHYPESDGRFLPENPLQAHAIISVRNDLDLHLRHVPKAVLEGNQFIYYRRGQPKKCVAPDVYVVLDHVWKCRSPYRIWIEGKAPDFVLEVISPESEIRNRVDKKALYSKLGVQEYFVFQPDEARPGERLVGYRLWGEQYVELRPDPRSGPERELRSETLEVALRIAGPLIRVRNLETGKDYRSHRDLATVAEEATARANAENERAQAQAQRAEAATARAEAESARAESERKRAESAEAELAALKAFLAQSGKQLPTDE